VNSNISEVRKQTRNQENVGEILKKVGVDTAKCQRKIEHVFLLINYKTPQKH
jgi:hypothetical protein